jgi:PAS domain S-box-containing protein
MSDGSASIRVLCIDDDDAFCSMLVEWLGRVDPDIEADALTDPTEALGRLRTGEYECVVCDYDMPELTGLDVVEQVRERYPDLPFVLYTGKGSEEIASEAISRGVTDYLQKGSETERYELLANRIEKYVHGYRSDREHTLTEQRYQRLIEQSVVGIALSQDGVFEYVNPKFAEMFGYTATELVGTNALSLIDESDRPRVERAIEGREAGDVESVHYVVTGTDKHGDRFDIEVSGSRVIYDGETAILGVVEPLAARHRLGADVIATLTERLDETRDALDAPDDEVSPDALDTARESIAAARELVCRPQPDESAPSTPVDIGERLRAVWETTRPENVVLSVESTRTVRAPEPIIDRLFSELWRVWSGPDQQIIATVDATTDGFEMRIDPSADDAGPTPDPLPEPPVLSRVADSLGWDVFIAESDAGGAVYSFRGIDPTE